MVLSPSAFVLFGENIGKPAPQPPHDLLEPAQGDALIAAFEPMQRGGWQAELLGELGVSHLAALSAQELAELSLQGGGHAGKAAGSFIPDAEYLRDSAFTLTPLS